MTTRATLLDIYRRMLDRYGPQHWWPAETRFEVMVGAILTQSSAWGNVEKAIANLRSAGALSPPALRGLSEGELAGLVYPSGYYNAKARKLKALAEYLGARFGDDIDSMAREGASPLRAELMGVHGIGEETADDILLYAVGLPVFVVDSFTRRVLFRLGLAPKKGPYAVYQELFARHLEPDPGQFGEYHALMVLHAKDVCKKRPLCQGCCLLEICPMGRANVSSSPSLPESGS